MFKTSTYLHLAYLVSQKLKLDDIGDFYLGSVYDEKAANIHDDFDLGCVLHDYLNQNKATILNDDISIYDCSICDTEVIIPIYEFLKKYGVNSKHQKAFEVIKSLEYEAVPLYLVSEDKKLKYYTILNSLSNDFIQMIGQ